MKQLKENWRTVAHEDGRKVVDLLLSDAETGEEIVEIYDIKPELMTLAAVAKSKTTPVEDYVNILTTGLETAPEPEVADYHH